jgi:peptide/nickel transport system permease protein
MPRQQNWLLRQLRGLVSDTPGRLGVAILLFFIFVALFGARLAPYDPIELQYRPDGTLARNHSPSLTYPLGTTAYGRDVFSQIIVGTRVAVIVGFLSAVVTVFIGSNVGLWSGYFGGRIDNILMRIVDIAYGIPFLPFAIILVSLLGPSIWNVILVISVLFWRTTARIIRAQVLSIKERPFIWSARAAGAGDFYIIYRHVLPNVLPLILLYTALGVGTSVLTEAGLSFLGFGDPRHPSWGAMLNEAFRAGAARTAWWWIVPPGLCISFFVIATFMVGRSYETMADPRLRGGAV